MNIPPSANFPFTCVAMLIWCIANTVSATSAPEALQRYENGIESISREINTVKEHRNAIITRMGEIGKLLNAVDAESQSEADRKPAFLAGIDDINRQILSVAENITDTLEAQKFIQAQLESTPIPTLLEDALGKSGGKHRALMLIKYQLHKTNSLLSNLEQKKRRLLESRASLTTSQQNIHGSINKLTADRLVLVEKRKLLEMQFANLTTEIVQKQDRQGQLEVRLAEISSDPHQALFSAAEGKLQDPTDGKILHRYAEPKAHGLLKWEGLVIGAPLGQEINAVFDGTVVFADRMQELGNVAIIDHGEGYMSVYGMTDFLIVQAGQPVLRGDTIGTAGAGVGNNRSGLYFEVRHNANTLDPVDWLEMRNISYETGS